MTNICKLSRCNELLAPYTTFKIGGKADYFMLPQSVKELESAVLWAKKNNIQLFIIGGGSNLVINDDGFRGLVICTTKIDSIK